MTNLVSHIQNIEGLQISQNKKSQRIIDIEFKDELIDFSIRTGAPLEVVENLQSMEDEEDIYESIEEIWPDFPTEEDYLWNEDEY